MRFLNEGLLRALTGWQELRHRLSDEEGQTLAEDGLIMAVIAVVVVSTAVLFFRDEIVAVFRETTRKGARLGNVDVAARARLVRRDRGAKSVLPVRFSEFPLNVDGGVPQDAHRNASGANTICIGAARCRDKSGIIHVKKRITHRPTFF